MSLYYEYKFRNNCKKEEVRAVEEERELDCFCGKFLKAFLGRTVEIVTTSGDTVGPALFACYDKETGILTLVDGTTITYLCCNRIEQITPDPVVLPG